MIHIRKKYRKKNPSSTHLKPILQIPQPVKEGIDEGLKDFFKKITCYILFILLHFFIYIIYILFI